MNFIIVKIKLLILKKLNSKRVKNYLFIIKMKELIFDILYNLEKNKLICDSCLCKIVPLENICYYCDRKLCNYYLDNSYRHFVKCYTCNTQWCYYDGLYADYKCEKIGGYSNCEDYEN